MPAASVNEPKPEAPARPARARTPARHFGSLEDLLRAHVAARLEREVPVGDGPVFIYGAGRHTWWLLTRVPEARDLNACAILDDSCDGTRSLDSVPILTPATAMARFGIPRAVVLSTDTWQIPMTAAARKAFGPGCTLVDLYDGLPHGSYARDAIHEVGGALTYGLTSSTERHLHRCGLAMAPYFRRQGVQRVYPSGEGWRTFSIAQGLLEGGIEPVATAANAQATVECGPECAAPVGTDVLGVMSGARPWVDRSSRNGVPARASTGKRTRYLLRHRNGLGDVILSQGILPERIKTEIDPNAHITYATTRSCLFRNGSETTGWCADLVKANPWIDEIIDIDAPCEADLSYTLLSGDLYDHVYDYQAMTVELPPGRTDAKVYLTPEDKALAQRLVSNAKGPTIAVNMSLIGRRFRAWGEERTLELCRRIETQLGGTVVWIGWVPFGPYARPADGDRPLTVREQAALLSACDIHVCGQGGGANLSAAVGTQTLSLTGCHPARREGVAYFGNAYIEDPSRRHVEIYRYFGDLRVLTYADGQEPEWRVCDSETHIDADQYARTLWSGDTPIEALPNVERFHRVWSLSVDDVFGVLAEMVSARRSGRPAPGR